MSPRSLFLGAALILIGSGALPSKAFAQAGLDSLDSRVVYIECSSPKGRVTRGSGVVVSPEGHVVTASHVLGDVEATCAGSIGVADSFALSRMVIQPTLDRNVDIALLRFVREAAYNYARRCQLNESVARNAIVVAGFPGTTRTGTVSYREGVLSTTIPDPRGLLETDAATVAGMSGGPVFSKANDFLVGIVIGAEFDNLGQVDAYSILPSQFFPFEFDLPLSDEPCFRPSRIAKTATWYSGDLPIQLGVGVEEGSCGLTSIFGEFDSPDDRVTIEIVQDEYVLDGNESGDAPHGGTARCVWFE